MKRSPNDRLLRELEAVVYGIVVTSDPCYYIYCDYLRRAGYEVLAVPEGPRGLEAAA